MPTFITMTNVIKQSLTSQICSHVTVTATVSTLKHLHSSQSNVQVAKTSTQLKQHNRCETAEPWPVVHRVKGKTGIDKIVTNSDNS